MESLLKLIVNRIVRQAEIALARIWLVGPGDLCSDCHMRTECADQTSCLHLVASAGSSKQTGQQWTNLDGFFRRFPSGVRKVGKIASSGEPLEVRDIAKHPEILARPGKLRFDLPTDQTPPRTDPPEAAATSDELEIVTDDEMRHREHQNIVSALKRTRWKLSGDGGAADLLGIKPTTLASRMKKMGIERPV